VVLVELGLDSRHSVASRGTSTSSVESYSGAVVRFLDGQPGRSVALTFDEFDDTAYLVASLRPNTNAFFDVPSLDGYDGGDQVTTRWATAMGVLTDGPFDPVLTLRSQLALPVDAATLARYGVRWMVLDTRGTSPEEAVPGWLGPLASDGPVQLFENPAWQGEAVAWFNTTPATGADDAARILKSGAAPPNSAVVEGGGPTLSCDGPCPSVGLAVERSRPERVTVTADLPRAGVVALDEQDDGGWSVTIDGHHADTVTVNGLLVGTRVPPGQHVVRFSYEPPGFRAGLWLALIGLLLLAAAAVRAFQDRRAVTRATKGPNRLAPTRSPTGEYATMQ